MGKVFDFDRNAHKNINIGINMSTNPISLEGISDILVSTALSTIFQKEEEEKKDEIKKLLYLLKTKVISRKCFQERFGEIYLDSLDRVPAPMRCPF